MSASASRKFSASINVRASENLFWIGVGSTSIFRHVSTSGSALASSSRAYDFRSPRPQSMLPANAELARSTSPASKATSPSWKNFSNFVESAPTS